MVSIPSLWAPILLSAVLVFVASFIFHMLLPFHRADYRKLPAENDVIEALRKFNVPPGDYMMPCGEGPASMKDPAFLDKLKRGPVALMTFMKPGPMNMGPQLAQWFIYCIVVAILAAYVTGRALGPGVSYLQVFRFAGVTSFIAYSIAQWQESIWHKRSWGTTIRNTIDGLIFGLLSGGAFGWLWPR